MYSLTETLSIVLIMFFITKYCTFWIFLNLQKCLHPPLNFMILAFLKSIAQLFHRMSLTLGLSHVSLRVDSDYSLLAGMPRRVAGSFPMHHIGGTCLLVPLLAMLTWIICLRLQLPVFSTVIIFYALQSKWDYLLLLKPDESIMMMVVANGLCVWIIGHMERVNIFHQNKVRC